MKKIKDRILLGVVAGLCGNLIKTAVDEVSLRKKISQRSFRETASGVWVLHIPAYPDGETGGIRTANRNYPDTLSIDLI